MFKKVFLSYNSDGLQDGYFSQLQRQMAIYSLAKQFGFSYHHTEISNVTITPLDPYQTIREAKNFIIKNNNIYNFGKNTENIAFSKTIEIHTPTLFQILWVGIKSIFSDEKVKIKIVIPYRIIERTPKSYSYIVNHLSKNLNQPTGKINKIKFVIHARKGVIESHITPGENSPRALKTEYYIAVLKHIFKTNLFLSPTSLTIVTDAPEIEHYFNPITEQRHLQKEFGYLESNDGIKVEGHNFSDIKKYFPGEVNIIRGGDAQEAVSIMSVADYLIMSRSSMSYVGALLNNNGTIYYPPNFWHKPLKTWVKVANFIDE